ncbi:MAG: 50S ribosomal protein L3 [Patescibacteria group bacterium]|nr:50S ribosomal protein L3 [Patescibacteria group bacterium]
MLRYLIGKKGQMSQTFDNEGKRIPVTTIETGDCYIVDIKKNPLNGRVYFVLGFQKAKHVTKPIKGILDKAGIPVALRCFREYPAGDSISDIVTEGNKKMVTAGEFTYRVGDKISASDLFKEGDVINVTGTSKGKGFQGVVKRHNFRGGPRTHGQSDRERAPGSLGQTTTPGKVYKGKRMAGRMGNERITVRNLVVISVSGTEMTVKGLVPGFKNAVLEITNKTA